MSFSENHPVITPEVLVPYNEFNPSELGRTMFQLVNGNADLLEARNLIGLLARYGNSEKGAADNVELGQSEHPALGHFAVQNAGGEVVGSASTSNTLLLQRFLLPLPAKILPSQLKINFRKAHPNIHAWTADSENSGLLTQAYNDLLKVTGHFWNDDQYERAWTIEPVTSPIRIHRAIASSGLKKVGTRRYYNEESRSHTPPIATLYATLESDWITVHGREKELRKGSTSLGTGFVRATGSPYES